MAINMQPQTVERRNSYFPGKYPFISQQAAGVDGADWLTNLAADYRSSVSEKFIRRGLYLLCRGAPAAGGALAACLIAVRLGQK